MSGLSDPRSIFGIHSLTAYSRTTGLPYGPELRVLDSSSIAMSGQLQELMGGSSKFSWAAEDGQIKAEMDIKAQEFPDWMIQLFLGATPTENAPDTTGTVSTLTNKQGTSVMNATSGIASVIVKTANKGDLKFGKYVIKAVTPSTVDVYLLSDIDAGRGTSGPFVDDDHKVTVDPLTVTGTDGTVDVPDYGLTITGGSGSVTLVAGDTATFEVLPPSSKAMSVVIGGQSSSFPEFGALALAQKRGSGSYSAVGVSTGVTGEMFEIDCFRCKAAGMPIEFNRNAWAKVGVKATLLYDSAQGGIAKIRAISPS